LLKFRPFRRVLPPLALAVAFGGGSVADAIFYVPELRAVPVDRLVANLEAQLKQDPANVEVHLNLARLHAMAYALKTSEAQVGRYGTKEEIWYGPPNSKLIPYEAKPAASPEQAAEAAEHLRRAISEYETVLKLDPDNLPGRLGHGWILEQSGSKAEAIAEYREVIARAWPKESTSRRTLPGTRYYTDEAVDYLVPLLDPAKDAAEIATLRGRQEKLRSLPRAITPIALRLSDDLTLPCDPPLVPTARVRFDADGSGLRETWTWIAADAAWLVHDPTGDGSITSALQLFGNVTFWLFWENGYHALRALDDNADGALRGPELAGLAVWQDVNSNGVSEPGEVRPLAAAGIVAVSVSSDASEDPAVAAWAAHGVQFTDGRWGATWDVVLHNIASTSTPTTASTEIATRVHDVMRLMPSSRSSGYACPSCGDIR
jgi:tetratricopeptide (TPR) repeat protein